MQEWYKLNYYNVSFSGHIESEIVNAGYFISTHGRTNPLLEYKSFISAMRGYIKKNSKPAQDILCKFPARLTLLSNQIPWFPITHRPKCKEYIQKNNPDDITSISLVFASGYFDNPSSYYGHTLIKYNYKNPILNQNSLDASLNYGADVTDDVNSPFYVIKGLFGGYGASYQRNNAFLNSHIYANVQMRDLWDYTLNLDVKQVRYVVEHAWELMNAQFDYYFFNDNCAHRIARLVEMATNKEFSHTHGFWLMPMQVVKKMHEGDMIIDMLHKPSLKSKLMSSYQNLSAEDKDGFKGFFNANHKPTYIKSISSGLLLLILDHLDVNVAKLTVKSTNSEELNNLQALRQFILFELISRKDGYVEELEVQKHTGSILEGNSPSMLSVGYGVRNREDVFSFRYQIANNDLLTPPIEGQGVSRFIMGAIEGEVIKGNLDFTEITLIDIANLNTNPLPMSLTNEYSWSLKVAYGQLDKLCHNCSAFSIQGGLGKSLQLNRNTMAYSLFGVQIKHKKNNNSNYALFTSESGMITHLNDSVRLDIGLDISADIEDGNPRYLFDSTIAFDLKHNNDFRFNLQHDGDQSMLMAKVGFYFN